MRTRYYKTLITVCSIVLAASSCSLATSPAVGSSYGSGSKRVLFIGNSLTAFNSMPAFFVALAESAKVTPLPTVDVEWRPDYALIDHWNAGEPQPVISAGKYSVVVLQQGPSSVEANRDTLRLTAKLFAPLIRGAGGVPALLAVWPTSNRLVDFDRATESYRLAAQDVGGMMIPSGEVWRAAWRRDPSLAFFSSDGLHPSPLGSYAMALSVFGILYDRSVVGLPSSLRLANGTELKIDPATAAIIQQAADEANRQFGSKGTP